MPKDVFETKKCCVVLQNILRKVVNGKGKVNVNGKVVSLQKYISIFTPHKSGHKVDGRAKLVSQ